MFSFVVFSFWCALSVSITGQAKQATITVNTGANGISILENSGSVLSTSAEWKVTFLNQESYDLLLKLSNEWGFDPINPSNITLVLNGINYNNAEGDLLLVFSVSNSQYFGVVVRNEISSQLYKVYPQPFASSLPKIDVEYMISHKEPDRWDRITRNGSWYNTIPIYKNPSGLGTEWPIVITVLNDPIANTVRYSQSDSNTNTELYSATYLESFVNDQGLDIYIMSDGSGESFGIFDITVTYHIEYIHTQHPTSHPTVTPSIPPTTMLPSTSPTTYPTVTPSNIPSIAPITTSPITYTTSPTDVHTFVPTSTPARYSTDITTESPTRKPIEHSTYTYFSTEQPNLGSVLEATLSIFDGTNDDTNVVISERGDINYVVIRSNHNDVALVSVLAACIGSVFCICALALLYCCIQNYIYRRSRKRCRSHSVKFYEQEIDDDDVGASSITIPAHQAYHDGMNENNTDHMHDKSRTWSVNVKKSDDEKEGELVTVNGVGVDMTELMQLDTHSHDSKAQMIHAINVHTISYDRMQRYLNDEMSSSSHENNLEEIIR